MLPSLSLSSSNPPNLGSVRTTSKSLWEYSTSAMVRYKGRGVRIVTTVPYIYAVHGALPSLRRY